MPRIIIILLLTAGALNASAQYVSKHGRFQANEKSGCAPLTVNISIIAPAVCDGSNPCSMDFEGNNNFQTLTFAHTYTTPGTYWLRVVYQAIFLDSLEITVAPNIAPSFDLYACGGNAVTFKVTDTNYSQYVVDFNDASPTVVVPSGSLATGMHTYGSSGNKTVSVRGRNLSALDNCAVNNQSFNAVTTLAPPTIDQLVVLDGSRIQLDFFNQPFTQYKLEIARNSTAPFQQLQTVYNTSSVTIPNLKTETEYYCFRLGAFDPCNNTTVYSNTICSADFDLSVQDNLNRLSWQTATPGLDPVTGFSITRNNQINYLGGPSALTFINDIDVVCKTDYCYQLVNNYTNGSRSYSLTKCGTAFSTTIPTAVQNITASIDDSGVTLSWTQDPDFVPTNYTISKSINGGAFGNILNSTTQSTVDPNYINGTPTCYRITYVDQCDNVSVSEIDACVITLTAALQSDNSVILNWSEYAGWQSGVNSYSVEKYSQSGGLIQTINVGTATTLTDDIADLVNQVYIYVVKATAVDPGLGLAVSNDVTIIKEPNLFYPTAFTPNGDGLNDSFIVYGQYVVDFDMKIFNRWGELLFTTSNINTGWNGTFKGTLMPEDSYVFVAKLTDFAGRSFDRSGSVMLLWKDK